MFLVVAAVTVPPNRSLFIFISKEKVSFNKLVLLLLDQILLLTLWNLPDSSWVDISSFHGSRVLWAPGYRCQDTEIRSTWTRALWRTGQWVTGLWITPIIKTRAGKTAVGTSTVSGLLFAEPISWKELIWDNRVQLASEGFCRFINYCSFISITKAVIACSTAS